MFEQQDRVAQAAVDKPRYGTSCTSFASSQPRYWRTDSISLRSSTISSTLVAALASEEGEMALPAVPQTINPLKNHHKYRHLEDLSEGSAGFVVRAENRDTHEQVQPQPDHICWLIRRHVLGLGQQDTLCRWPSSSSKEAQKLCGGWTGRCST